MRPGFVRFTTPGFPNCLAHAILPRDPAYRMSLFFTVLIMTRLRRLMVAAAIVLLTPALAHAVPRYSARYEQKCALCHTNPTGGGMRNLYASQYLVPEEMAWSKPKKDILSKIDPEISKGVVIGTDFRLFHRYSNDDQLQTNFFQMQGDIYLDFQMDDNLSLYYDQGISSSYELFGLWQGLPLTGYVKAGRFVPSYGWRFDDHTMFVRSQLGFMPPANSDVGIEFGVSPGRSDIQLAVLNGNRGSTYDTNKKLAACLNGVYRFHLADVGVALGGAGYWQDGNESNYGTGGFFGSLTWWRLVWLGELDYTLEERHGDDHTTGLVTSHEVSYLWRQGLELRATYDFFDGDYNVKSGARSRWGGGVFVMPRSFLALEALYRKTTYEDGAVYAGDDSWETLLQFHLLY
jgi:hypothetical protein